MFIFVISVYNVIAIICTIWCRICACAVASLRIALCACD